MILVDSKEIKIVCDVHIWNPGVEAEFVYLLLHCSNQVFESGCRRVRWTAAMSVCFDSM